MQKSHGQKNNVHKLLDELHLVLVLDIHHVVPEGLECNFNQFLLKN